MSGGVLKFVSTAIAQAVVRTFALAMLIAMGLSSESILQWLSGSLGYRLPWYLSPQSVGLSFFLAAVLVAISIFYGQYQRDHGYASARNIPALKLVPMSITETAVYILNHSSWGWRTYARLNLKEFVKDAVPDEMRRAARANEIRFVGALPNTATSTEIDPAYWQHIGFDRDRIWDSRNRMFTWFPAATLSIPGLMNYEYGSVPRVEVMHVWPRASMSLKLGCLLWVQMKKAWWWFKANVLRSS